MPVATRAKFVSERMKRSTQDGHGTQRSARWKIRRNVFRLTWSSCEPHGHFHFGNNRTFLFWVDKSWKRACVRVVVGLNSPSS
jgi:hypothetical protein